VGPAAALLLVVGLVLLSVALGRPPTAAPVGAPVDAFSAGRALEHLEVIATDGPGPIGSRVSDETRDYLVENLAALGLDARVEAGVGLFTNSGGTVAGRVQNVVATLPGTASTGRVILSAHYDTTFGSPGAGDDKAAVAAVLETARAVVESGSPLRNDLVFLLTDGEEPGMLGADAFVANHPAGPHDVVLNFEGTGNTGPSALFETSSGNAGLVSGYGRWAQRPVGDSAMAALYEAGGQNTDFTILKEAGYRGLNFALIDGTAYYHHSRDTVSNLDAASVQHHGNTMLALARGFGNEDLSTLDRRSDRTFFTVLGTVVSYPQAMAGPLAGVAAVLVLALAVAARRRGRASTAQLVAGAVAALASFLVVMALTLGGWQVLVRLRPGFGTLFMGDPFQPSLFRWALVATVLATASAAHLLLRRRVGLVALHLGGLFWLAVLAVAGALLEPAVSFYGAVPASLAAGAGLLAPRMSTGWARLAIWVIGVTPGCVVLVSGGLALLGVLGLSGAAAGTVFLLAAAWLLLPLWDAVWELLDRPRRRRARLVPLGLTALAGALVVAGLGANRFDSAHPQSAHLSYVEQAGEPTGTWFSDDRALHPWTARHTPVAARDATLPPLPYGTTAHWVGRTRALGLPAPEVTVLEARPGTTASIDLHVRSRRDADVLVLHVNRPVSDVSVRAEKHRVVAALPDLPAEGASQPWPYELRFYDPPPEGIRVMLELAGPTLPVVFASDYTVGLDTVPGFTPRSGDLERSPAHGAELLVVGRELQPTPVHRKE